MERTVERRFLAQSIDGGVGRRWPALALAGALAVLVSFYLTWEQASVPSGSISSSFDGTGGPSAGLPNLASGAASFDVGGWSAGASAVAALAAVALAGVALFALARPGLVPRLPVGILGLSLGYFVAATALETRSVADQLRVDERLHLTFAFGSGAYLGLAGAAVALLASGGMRGRELLAHSRDGNLVFLLLAGGLLATLLLPWGRLPVEAFTQRGVESAPGIIAASLAFCLPAAASRRGRRLGLAGVVVVLVAAALSTETFPVTRAYGAWAGLGVAVALAALALAGWARTARLVRPSWDQLSTVAATIILLVGLFLPWRTYCYPRGSEFGPAAGRCISETPWAITVGSTLGLLALALVAFAFAPRLRIGALGLAVGVGLLAATVGFEFEQSYGGGFRIETRQASIVTSFVGAALLVGLSLLRARPWRVDRRGLPRRLAAVVGCTGYVLVVLVPWWGVLPAGPEAALTFAPPSWLTMAGLLVALSLLGLWAERAGGAKDGGRLLVLLPLGLLALATITLVEQRAGELNWGGGIAAGLGLALALAGTIEQRGGLADLKVPELLRIDRL